MCLRGFICLHALLIVVASTCHEKPHAGKLPRDDSSNLRGSGSQVPAAEASKPGSYPKPDNALKPAT